MKRIHIFVLLVAALMFATGDAVAQQFPGGPADDNTTSLGSFRIYINPEFQPLFAGYPGYNAGTSRLDSPVLYDPATIIGRSDTLFHGGPSDVTGVPVGTAGTIVGDQHFTVQPPGFQGPPGTKEIHTEVAALNMTDVSGAAVRAGTFAPARPISPGEVESWGSDFPAESFFDVFVEVDIPNVGTWAGPNMLVANDIALLVENDTLLALPPRVVYIHRNSTAVPVRFLNDNTPTWTAGDILGFLVLAGHGLQYTPGDAAEFEDIMNQQEEMPLPAVPSITPYGMLILLALLILSAVYVLYRKRATARA